MKFVFDPNQEFQLDAIEAVAQLFEGMPKGNDEMSFIPGTGFAVRNNILLSEDVLLRNLNAIQEKKGLPKDEQLHFLRGEIVTATGKLEVAFPNFSVEMETGTGKTYVYIRTAFELRKRYGLSKFIIVVPSVAIRQGVLKSFQMLDEHLRNLYDNMPFRYYVYDSNNLSQVRQFAASDSLEFMVMTLDSFNKAMSEDSTGNVIFRPADRLQGGTPIHFIQATRPILILDEPQNMESELSKNALTNLMPLIALRYSATHRNAYNPVYKLTPFDAYRQSLVKKVQVAGYEQAGETGGVFVKLLGVQSKKHTLTAKLTVHALTKGGTIAEKIITVKPGESLEVKANRSEYAELIIEELFVSPEHVRFTNGLELMKGQALGPEREALFREQIRYTIEEHFRRQRQLKEHGIKVLSLFFIDQVDSYVSKDGIVKNLFIEAYEELKELYPEWKNKPVEAIQAAYFASRRNMKGDQIYLDTGGTSQRDIEAYELIMNKKEQLLSFEEPTCFIFSHSALREGWDNPNVFQICALRTVGSDISRRQQIGRGIRLAVNQQGERIHDDQVNILTVVASENYENFVHHYQDEIVGEYGKEGLPPTPRNARQRVTAKLRKQYLLKPEFKELWERIKHKTRYSVTVNTPQIIQNVIDELDKQVIPKPTLQMRKASMVIGVDDKFDYREKAVGDAIELTPMMHPNLLEGIGEQLERTTPPVRLTRQTLLEIFRRTRIQQSALDNPQEFIARTARIIKQELAAQLIGGIKYEKLNEWYEMHKFLENEELTLFEEYVEPSLRPEGDDGAGLYDSIGVDSDPERQFVKDLERRDDVKLYVKLPAWFEVQTPVGGYNPDWAIVVTQKDERGKKKDTLYLVAETKSTMDWTKLRPDERHKITCGERHFGDTLGVPYKWGVSVRDILP